MRTTESKNQNNQLPAQVAAEKTLHTLLTDYFDCNSLKGVNGTLMELVSAAVGPDPRSGNHSLLDICNTLDDIRNTLNLIRKLSVLVNEQSMHDYLKTSFFEIAAVSEFDIDYIDNLLFRAFDRYILQDATCTDISLEDSEKITMAFNMVYQWISECNDWLLFAVKKGGFSC